ncbi:MAG: hypothetical protein KDA24_04770 [Deltaproteobacteria bacterium]|nr:hypothetical protein [Deltaproteobacteria bacterium]
MSFIVGVGVASPLGLGLEASMEGWLSGASGLAENPLPHEGLSDHLAGIVPGFRPRKQLPDRKAVKLMSREAQLLVHAAVEACGGTDVIERLELEAQRVGAFAAAGYEVTPLDEVLEMFRRSREPEEPTKLSLERLFTVGRDGYNPLSPLKTLPNMALFHAATALGLRGPHLALGSSPAAGLAALSGAHDALADDLCDHALVGGTDAQVELYRIHYLEEAGVLAGSSPAEGAAALLLAAAPDAESPVRIVAVGLAQEPPAGPVPGDHYSSVSDRGETRTGLYTRVLEEAWDGGAPPVDLVVADLWGLPTRDAAERSALATVLSHAGTDAPILSTRPRTGHMGAAHGVFDVALACELLRRGDGQCALVTAGGSAGDLGAVVLHKVSA